MLLAPLLNRHIAHGINMPQIHHNILHQGYRVRRYRYHVNN